MNGQNDKKLNQLMKEWPSGTVAVQPWLEKRGIYRQLSKTYVKSGWISQLERGAYTRGNESVNWMGGLYALQKQLGLTIHAGAKTALSIKGYAHYLTLGTGGTVTLFGPQGEKLPAWFRNASWKEKLLYSSTNLFEESSNNIDQKKLGLTEYENNTFSVNISAPERAIMELIYHIPKHANYDDAHVSMESLTTLRPSLVQSLLENCNSVKVKRFFMWLAENYQHKWLDRLNLDKIDFGKGKRVIAKDGVFNKKYNITVPKFDEYNW